MSRVVSRDRRQIFKELFPEFLNDNREYSVLIDTYVEEMGIIADYIEMFSNLKNADKTPSEFLQDLADLVNYSYSYSENEEMQREIIKRMFHVHENRGSHESIVQAVQLGHDIRYVGRDLTQYQGKIQKATVYVEYTRDYLFRYSISMYDDTHRYQDRDRYRDGVIVIKSSIVNDRVKEILERTIAAGWRYYLDSVLEVDTGTDEFLSFAVKSVNVEVILYEDPETINQREDFMVYDERLGKVSGSTIMSELEVVTKDIYVTDTYSVSTEHSIINNKPGYYDIILTYSGTIPYDGGEDRNTYISVGPVVNKPKDFVYILDYVGQEYVINGNHRYRDVSIDIERRT